MALSCSVPSQCIQSRTIGNPKSMMSVTTKIALQLNCKLGGELWALEIPVREEGGNRKKKHTKRRTFAALCSLDL